jgi:magnesium-protoporphyrin IX monomethyl ester (oxidative) cyclase|uniref:Magnesium-protoporphyrin IX monomethyl ester [oxidative] cyclase n=1 Tax=Cyanidiaceae sp. MX-AZ01 TaxID=1503164 RepID=A0A060A941_9RHOD|nr:magnesium-protoporphyrin IX monomethyl ester cyclase [Cyanidiaceae sp. MX-AZ01]
MQTQTLLTPRFYTTDFDEMAKYDISGNRSQIEAIVNEFKKDYNQTHFIRDEEFDQVWAQLPEANRQWFREFLERSCTAEFSGFLLYKELSRRLKESNPLLAEGFAYMSRDEARHAGFLNKALADFGVSLDLGFLTKHRQYTFFQPKFIFYATYLSEKIGYWRYITIYRHLESHPKWSVYPIFKFFEKWCQDENRHGDFFAAILKAKPQWLTGLASELWCRFFLLSVFVTMYLNDLQRKDFYQLIGLDARTFDIHVIRKTNESSARLFPVVLDVDHIDFFRLMDACACAHEQWRATKNPLALAKVFIYLLRLYLIKPINTQALWNTIK